MGAALFFDLRWKCASVGYLPMTSVPFPPALDILGLGSPIMDLTAHVSESFLAGVRGEKGGMVLVDAAEMDAIIARLPEPPSLAPGGSAANVIRNAARLGLRAGFLGKLGGDHTAAAYREHSRSLGLDATRFKASPDRANARCLALITPDAARTMRTDLGAALTLAPGEIQPVDFTGVRHAHIEGYLVFNQALADSALAGARASGATVSLDIASFEVVHAARDWMLAQLRAGGIHQVFANEDEIRALYPDGGDDYAGHARRLAGESPGLVAVVKVGKDGAWIARGEELHRVAPVVVERVVDTNGAGDAFAGGFLYATSQGWSLERSGALGAALGAECVRHSGPAIPGTHWGEVAAVRDRLARG
jgi:sugar/nucleoside kinase (ribokinase family)